MRYFIYFIKSFHIIHKILSTEKHLSTLIFNYSHLSPILKDAIAFNDSLDGPYFK